MMEDMNGWFMVPPINSFNPFVNGGSAESKKAENVDANSVEGNNSKSSLSRKGSSSSISVLDEEEFKNTCRQIHLPNCPRNDVTFNTNSTSTVHQSNETVNEYHSSEVVSEFGTNCELKFPDDPVLSFLTTFFKVFSKKEKYTEPFSNTVVILGGFLCVIAIISGFLIIMEMETLNTSITFLNRDNHLLKQQVIHQRKENRRLEILIGSFFNQLKEKENTSRNCQQQIELESFYQEEINQLKEQVSFLEGDYETLKNHFKKVNSILEELKNMHEERSNNASNIDNQIKHSNASFEKFRELIMLYGQKLNLTEIETKCEQNCFQSIFEDHGFIELKLIPNDDSFSRILSDIFETLNMMKNYILEKGIIYRFVEYIGTFLKDSISTILFNFFETLDIIKNYILEKDIKTRFVEYTDALKDGISTGCELSQRFFMCLEQERVNKKYKNKVKQIKNIMNILLERLEELNTDMNI